MIKVKVTGGEEAVQKFEQAKDLFLKNMQEAVARSAFRLVRHVKEDKLSGQLLNVRSGRLRRSITSTVEIEDNKVTGYVGTNVEYAHVHEYGFHGVVGVRAYMRQGHPVRAHQRMMNVTEKAFLRSAIQDLKDDIVAEMAAVPARTFEEIFK